MVSLHTKLLICFGAKKAQVVIRMRTQTRPARADNGCANRCSLRSQTIWTGNETNRRASCSSSDDDRDGKVSALYFTAYELLALECKRLVRHTIASYISSQQAIPYVLWMGKN